VSAEQILHIVLGGREHNVDARLIHQTVEARVVERDSEAFGGLGIDVHDIGSGREPSA
jgi:hypothetical protein